VAAPVEVPLSKLAASMGFFAAAVTSVSSGMVAVAELGSDHVSCAPAA
jgi:hypothetical protein